MKYAMKCAGLATMMLLSGCTTNGGVLSEFCEEAAPIYVSVQDHLTATTARHILEHNEKGRVLCGWKRSDKG